ncbi:hypothetical protein SDJN03_23086, partial [Cucurbita argyrosperma subsp. sororia]
MERGNMEVRHIRRRRQVRNFRSRDLPTTLTQTSVLLSLLNPTNSHSQPRVRVRVRVPPTRFLYPLFLWSKHFFTSPPITPPFSLPYPPPVAPLSFSGVLAPAWLSRGMD